MISIAHAGFIDDAPSLAELFMNGLQIILGVVSVIAVVAIVITGAMYIFASGNEQNMGKAKKAFNISRIGLIIALVALMLVKLLTKLVA